MTYLEMDVTGPDEVPPQCLQEPGGGAGIGDRVGRGHDGLELEPPGGVGCRAPEDVALGTVGWKFEPSPAALACHTSTRTPAGSATRRR